VCLGWARASSPPEGRPASMPASMPASLSPPETVVEPEGVGVRTVCPARSCELTPLEPCDEPG